MTTFYAELLPNIKSISLSIHLATPSDASTRALLASDGATVHLQHSGNAVPIALPARAALAGQKLLDSLCPGQNAMSYRLPIEPEIVLARASENYTPWSALELSAQKDALCFCCRACNSTLISGRQVQVWKDLPSTNWAELMDFWHCHKPPEDGSDGKNSGKYDAFGRGYVFGVGIGLVEGGCFLLPPESCQNIKITASRTPNEKYALLCQNCSLPLGHVDYDMRGGGVEAWRVYKWTLLLQHNDLQIAYPLECFLSAQFISLADYEGTRRLLVTSDLSDTKVSLKIWVFNTDIRYTHSTAASPIRGLKIFYMSVVPLEDVTTGSLSARGFELLSLDDAIFTALQERLQESNLTLCPELRKFSEWNVGTLRRFENSI